MEYNFLSSAYSGFSLSFHFFLCPFDFTVTKFFFPFNIQLFDSLLITSSYSALTQTFFSSSLNPSVPFIFPLSCITPSALTQQSFQKFFYLLHSACYLSFLNSLLDSFSVITVNNNGRNESFHRKQNMNSTI